jgi:glycosyltransferase involved in cell wall biosynthesis
LGHVTAASDSRPLVTIVTPSFNQAPFLRAAIESVLTQEYPRVEYIILDGGSSDNSIDILREFDGRVRWQSRPDDGQADALASGFALARGAIFGWLNADDLLHRNALAEAVAFLEAHPEIALVYGDAVFVDAGGNEIMPCRQVRPFDLKRLRYGADYIVQPSAFFRRSAYEAVGGIDRNLHWSMDYDLWLKIAERHGVAYVPRTWSGYRLQPRGKTVGGGFARIEEVAAMTLRHGLALPADFRIEKAALHLKQARRALADGHAREAFSALWSGIVAIGCSRRALQRFCSWPLWRDIWYNRAALARHGIGTGQPRPLPPLSRQGR